MICLESCEVLSEIRVDDFYFKITLSPVHEGSCILWFADARLSDRFKALGRFSFFDKQKVLQFVFNYCTNDELREDIETRKFECRIKNLSTVYFGQFERMPNYRRLQAYRELFDLDGVIDKKDLVRRRKLMAKVFHPDCGGDNRAMSVINQAYETLLPHARGN
ncbi:MAG: J domain-containing protein [Spartobacteria bacterium]|nr:J domain-containing protein [Spartobacteria bacterium]